MNFFFNGYNASNKPVATFDHVSGYKCNPGENRRMYASSGKLEYDHTVTVNKQGWFSERDYSYTKKTGVKRWVVLGDSYSSGSSIPQAWPDMWQSKLNRQDSIELYNFSLDGAGIMNWYRIFKYDIIANYEFDGVVIAASSEKNGYPNFDRNFIMAQSSDKMNFMRVIDLGKSDLPNSFDYLEAVPIAPVCTDDEMNFEKAKILHTNNDFHLKWRHPDLYFLYSINQLLGGLKNLVSFLNSSKSYQDSYANYELLADTEYRIEYFKKRYNKYYLLDEIMNYCKSNRKQILFIGIPDKENALDFIQGKEIIYRKEMSFLSDYYGAKYFDGYTIFSGKNESFVTEKYYEFDGHWNTIGEELFVDKLIDDNTIF